MRCLSLEKIELHSSASSEMITGDRSEVKRLVKLVTTWIFEDPCIMIVHSLLSGRKGGEIVFRCFFVYRVFTNFDVWDRWSRDEFADQISRLSRTHWKTLRGARHLCRIWRRVPTFRRHVLRPSLVQIGNRRGETTSDTKTVELPAIQWNSKRGQ